METTTGKPPVDLTDSAVKEVSRMMESQAKNIPDAGLRIAVRGGGCSGLSYDMSFDNKISEHDQSSQQVVFPWLFPYILLKPQFLLIVSHKKLLYFFFPTSTFPSTHRFL